MNGTIVATPVYMDEAAIREMFDRSLKDIEIGLIAISMMAGILQESRADAERFAISLVGLREWYAKLVEGKAEDYAQSVHKLFGAANSLYLGVNILRRTIRTVEGGKLAAKAFANCETMNASLKMLVERLDPKKFSGGSPVKQ